MAAANEGVICMKFKPKVLVLKADGINCDEELVFAFSLAGGEVHHVHINEFRAKKDDFKYYHILALPGGFSYGDDIVSGKILAVELTSFFSENLRKFIARENTLTIGVCNGFQVLARTGLLPFGDIGTMSATLTNNASGHFECRWIKLKVDSNTNNVFLQNMKDRQVTYQVAHGEGKFYVTDDVLKKIEQQNLVALRYVDEKGAPTQNYPDNPNGSLNAIAGISDPSGRILGLMPHPERFVLREQYVNWRRRENTIPDGLPIFKNMIEYIKGL